MMKPGNLLPYRYSTGIAGMIPRAAFHKLNAMVKGCKRPSKIEAARGSDCIVASDLDQVIAQARGLGGFEARNPDVGRMSARRVQNQRRQTENSLQWPSLDVHVLQPRERQESRALKYPSATRLQNLRVDAVTPRAVQAR